MKINVFLGLLFVVVTQSITAGILTIENHTKFPCDVQPVVDAKSEETMGAFKYTIQPGKSVSYWAGLYTIKGVRWRINIYFDDNKKLARHYYMTEIPTIDRANVNALLQIGSNGEYYYNENKKSSNWMFKTSKHLKYIYLYGKKGWAPLVGTIERDGSERSFPFQQENALDMYK